jgi:hypothetical protein
MTQLRFYNLPQLRCYNLPCYSDDSLNIASVIQEAPHEARATAELLLNFEAYVLVSQDTEGFD